MLNSCLKFIILFIFPEKEHDVSFFDDIPENIEVDFSNPIHVQPEKHIFGKNTRFSRNWDKK